MDFLVITLDYNVEDYEPLFDRAAHLGHDVQLAVPGTETRGTKPTRTALSIVPTEAFARTATSESARQLVADLGLDATRIKSIMLLDQADWDVVERTFWSASRP